MHDDRAARREARKHWRIAIHRLGDDDRGVDTTTTEQRIAMMRELVVQAWAGDRRICST